MSEKLQELSRYHGRKGGGRSGRSKSERCIGPPDANNVFKIANRYCLLCM